MPREQHKPDCICTECEETRLIDAANLLGDHAGKHLPEGWEYRLVVTKDESYAELIDPDGDEIEYQGGERGYSDLSAACDHAREIECHASDPNVD